MDKNQRSAMNVGESVTVGAVALIHATVRRLLNLLMILPTKCKLQATTVNNLSNRVPESFDNGVQGGLWQYIQRMSPETVTQLSKPSSSEVLQVMERTITEILGNLPSGQFGVTVTTSREHLSQLLASAMINGYFLHNVEQRVAFEKSLLSSTVNATDS